MDLDSNAILIVSIDVLNLDTSRDKVYTTTRIDFAISKSIRVLHKFDVIVQVTILNFVQLLFISVDNSLLHSSHSFYAGNYLFK